MRVFITGRDGFSAINLEKYLKKKNIEVKRSFVDILDFNKLKKEIKDFKPDWVVNLAGISYVNDSDLKLYEVNTIGSENVVKASECNVLIVSSAYVYKPSDKNLKEDDYLYPINHYGVSKLGAEVFANDRSLIVRPFNYTGIGQSEKFVVPKIVKAFKKDLELNLGDVEAIREFNSVEFVCEAYYRLMKKNITQEIVNISSSREVKVKDIIEILKDLTKKDIIVKINKIKRKRDIKRLVGDSKKLFSLVGEIKQKDLKEMLKEMYEACC